MSATSYENITKLIEAFVEEKDLKEHLLKMHAELKEKMLYYPASTKQHHLEEGAYSDHIFEVMRFSIELFTMISKYVTLPFTKQDLTVVSYVHDVDKLWRYRKVTEDWKRRKGQVFEFNDSNIPYPEGVKVIQVCASYGILLSDKQIEAIGHHHGGFAEDLASTYSFGGRMTLMSTILHSADMLSMYTFGRKQ